MIYFRQSGNFHSEEDSFSKVIKSIAMITHDALLIKKFFQTKAQIKEDKYNFLWVLFYYKFIFNKKGGKLRFLKIDI